MLYHSTDEKRKYETASVFNASDGMGYAAGDGPKQSYHADPKELYANVTERGYNSDVKPQNVKMEEREKWSGMNFSEHPAEKAKYSTSTDTTVGGWKAQKTGLERAVFDASHKPDLHSDIAFALTSLIKPKQEQHEQNGHEDANAIKGNIDGVDLRELMAAAKDILKTQPKDRAKNSIEGTRRS